MNEEQLKALQKALNLPDSTEVSKVIETAQSAFQLSTSNATALTTANSAKTELENKLNTANASLATANAQVTTLTAERDTLQSANTGLTTTNAALIDGIVDAFEVTGKITPAQKPDVKAKFTANGANPAEIITELKTKNAQMNTKEIEIGNNRIDISTANARQEAVQTLVRKRMSEEKLEYGDAYAAVRADPKNKQLFEAMADPTRKAA